MNCKNIKFSEAVVFILSLGVVLVFAAPGFADVKLPSVISDNMVIQQGMKVPIRGWAEPGERISIGADWQSLGWYATADKNGKWMVKIDPPKKAGGPYEMTISGKNKITIKNVLAGEVWIASGQSNMEMSVGRFRGFKTGVNNYKQEIASANYPNIRLFTVEKNVADTPQKDCRGRWSVCTPKTIAGFSATAYFFGRQLHNHLNVPVGLIQTCWGGTPAEAWTSHDVLAADPEFRPITDRFKQAWSNHLRSMEDYTRKLTDWLSMAKQASRMGKHIPDEPHKPRSPRGSKSPSSLYNAMIAPLIPYGIRGAIWYQGESNVSRAYQYRKLFPAMIKNWRRDWGQGNFPFYYVQIAPFRYREQFAGAELREAQFMTLSVPNTGMAVTMDIGNVNNIHPTNKQDVGKRLALWALAKTYGDKGIVYSGPIYKSMKVEGDKIRLFFDCVGGGLIAEGGELTHFTIAGKDKKFFTAKAVIDSNTIVVSNDKVKRPVAVRFAWSNTAVPNLFNKEGLPASSFRTDNWPGVTYNRK